MRQNGDTLYSSLFENALEGIFRVSSEGGVSQFSVVNPALVRMLGYESAEEVLALKIPEDLYVDPMQRERLRAEYEPRGEVHGTELTWKKKNGEHLTVRLHARVLRDAQGRVIGYEGMVLDVTERKRAEQEREIIYQLARDLARSSDIPTMAKHIFALTKKLLGADYGFLMLANAEGAELQGVAAHGIENEAFRQERVVVATELTAVTIAFQRKEPVMILDRHRSPQVSPRLQEKYKFVRSVWIVPLMSGEKAVGTLAVGYAARREATSTELRLLQLLGDEAALALERARLTKEVFESEARYRTISELISDYAYAIRIEPDYTAYTMEWVTGAFTRIMGFTPSNELYPAQSWESLIHPEDLPVARKRLRRLLSGQADATNSALLVKTERYGGCANMGVQYGTRHKAALYASTLQDVISLIGNKPRKHYNEARNATVL